MKNFLNKIKSFFGKYASSDPSYGRKFLRPSRDWKIIFYSSFFGMIICAVGAFYFYKQVDAGEFFTINEENIENEVKINMTLLQKTVDDLNKRNENLQKALAGNIAPEDPSK